MTKIEIQEPALPACPFCGETMQRIWTATPVHFKGNGFYSTDGGA